MEVGRGTSPSNGFLSLVTLHSIRHSIEKRNFGLVQGQEFARGMLRGLEKWRGSE